MKLSTKARYGIRSLIDLAVHSKGESVTINSIAKRQHISDTYLEQIFLILRKSGYIKSIQGSQGGFILNKEPSKISIGEIFKALEGDIKIIEEDNLPKKNNLQKCIKEEVFDHIDSILVDLLSNLTLEEMVDEFKKKNQEEGYMYYI
ncbi:MAG: Rrf2 family transcriptional regulator [Tissierellales bacterium]|jgi:Rrf2 family protein|nr:Rrf2 family transcriptional regulator [Tissierellales bacterium]HCX04217.1 Rrf2 family transcriptional regulator [Clostridiales bacterium]